MLENLEKITDFKYGENRQQTASLYKSESSVDFELLNGGELTYINYLNMTALVELLSEFYDVFATVMAKTGLPFEIEGAICFKNQAQFHPLKYLNGLCHCIAKNNKRIEYSFV